MTTEFAASDLPTSSALLRRLFTTTAPAASLPDPGNYLITYLGPAALRRVAPWAIALGGMPGWRGKRFGGEGTAVNLLGPDRSGEYRPAADRANEGRAKEGESTAERDDDDPAAAVASLREVLPMQVTMEPSWLDGRRAIVCSYGADGPVPWRWVRDEFRPLDDHRLLGLTLVGGPWSRVVAAPLLLTRR